MKAGKQVQQVKKRLTIRKYMHMQFLRIGFAVSGVVGVLALIGIYEGILLAKEDTRFDLATENKIAIIVGVILAIVVISIVGVDLFLNKIANQVIRRVNRLILWIMRWTNWRRGIWIPRLNIRCRMNLSI